MRDEGFDMVVNLRKEVSEELKCEAAQRSAENESLSCKLNSLRDELEKEMQMQQEHSNNNLGNLQTLLHNVQTQVESCKKDVQDVEQSLHVSINEAQKVAEDSLKKLGRD